MVWPLVKIVSQLFGSVVGRSVVAAWKQVSTEQGNKEVFRQEISKAWKRQMISRFERSRLRRALNRDPMPEHMKPGDADRAPWNETGERMRQQFQEARKAAPLNPEVDELLNSKIRRMSPSEAIKVLHLGEATEKDIEKRFAILMEANGEAGASQYVHDKITHAKEVALQHLARGTLKKHFKAKPRTDTTPPPTDTPQ